MPPPRPSQVVPEARVPRQVEEILIKALSKEPSGRYATAADLKTALGASLGLGLSEGSYKLFQKLQWPDVGPVPCLVKPLSRRAAM